MEDFFISCIAFFSSPVWLCLSLDQESRCWRLREIKFESDIFLDTLICHSRGPNCCSDHWLTTGKRISKTLSFQAQAKIQIKLPTNQSTLHFHLPFAKTSFTRLLLGFQQKDQDQGAITCPLWRGSSADNECHTLLCFWSPLVSQRRGSESHSVSELVSQPARGR
jgi:hypothetical protein